MKYTICIKMLLLLASIVVVSCAPTPQRNYNELSMTDSDRRMQAVIEIPAGTNKKIEIDKETQTFKTDQRDGRDRVIGFLSYPGNYGFIAGTLSDKSKGGDGDAVDVLVIGEAFNTGEVVAVVPVAMLKLIDNGEEDFKILAVPADQSLNVLKLQDLSEDPKKGEAIKKIVETWFLNYDTDPATVSGWATKEETLKYIEANRVK